MQEQVDAVAQASSRVASPLRSVLHLLCILAAYQLVAVVLFRSVLIEGSKTLLGRLDTSFQSFAWITKCWIALQSGEFALWDFGVQSGMTFAGEMQTAPFYPLTILVSPFVTAGDPFFVDLFVIAHLGLGAFFMHLLLREFGLRATSCFVGAILFGFVGSVALRSVAQPNLHAGLVYMPLVALCAHRALEAADAVGSAKWAVLGGLSLGTSVLAGHIHGYVHMSITVPILVACLAWRSSSISWQRAVLVVAGLGLSSLGFALVQLLPSYEYLELAYKWYGPGFTKAPHVVPYDQFARHVLTSADLRTLFDPGAGAAVRDGGTLFLTWTGMALLATAGLFGVRGRLAIFSCVLVALSLVFATTADTVLGRVIYEIPVIRLVRIPTRSLHLYAFAMSILVALSADVVARWERPWPNLGRWAGLALALAVLFEANGFTRHLPTSVDGKLSPKNHYFGSPVVKELERRFEDEGRRYRYTSVPRDAIAANLGDVIPVMSAVGYRSSKLAAYHDYVARNWDVRSPSYDLLAVRYVVAKEPLEDLAVVGRYDDITLYERPNALPIFWLLSEDGERGNAPIQSIDWRTNSVRITLSSDAEGQLVFSQLAYPGWRVHVDGEQRPRQRYDVFESVALVRGDRVIEYVYRPLSVLLGALVSACTALLGIGLVAVDLWRGRRGARGATR